jgi:hypothetical protein
MRVMVLRVMPRKFMAMKDEITDMGRVSPVMTVERQEFRKQKTMSTVRRPPRTRVCWTSAIDSRMKREASRTSARQLASELGRLALDRVDDPDRVRPRLLEDVERHRGLAVHERERPGLLDPVPDLRHLAEGDRPARALGHHHGAELLGGPGLALHAQRDLDLLPVEPSERGVHVLRLEAPHDLVDAQAEGLEPRRVQLHLDLAGGGAHQVDLAHPGDVLDPPLDLLLDERRQLPGGEDLRAHGQGDDGKGAEVELLDDGLLEGEGQLAPYGRHLRPRVLRRLVGIHLELELHPDLGDALAGDGADMPHPRDRVHRLLDALADLPLHGLGGGALVDGHHGDHGDLHVREHVDGKPPVGGEAQGKQGQHHHGGEDRALDGEIGEEHGRLRPRSMAPSSPGRRGAG